MHAPRLTLLRRCDPQFYRWPHRLVLALTKPNQRASYQSLRSTVQSFREQLPLHLGDRTIDWNEKLRTMISLDFEAAVHLHQWINLPSLIEETRAIATEKLSTIFMNAILCSEAPTQEILRVVKVGITLSSPGPLETIPQEGRDESRSNATGS